ncbi:MAG: hypothetical protein WKG00_15350 [Polyangiaceae bacterium]
MHKRAFDAALRAALKITFSTTLLACGGTVDIDETTPVDVGPDDPGATSASGATSGAGGSGGDASLPLPTPRPESSTPRPHPEVCEGPLTPPVDWWTFDAHTFACCAQSLSAAIPAGDIMPWIEASWEDVDTQSCCTQITGPNMDALWSGQPVPHPAPDGVLSACCVLQVGVATCTAWGPPMPPAMDDADWQTWLALGNEDEDEGRSELGRAA